MLARTTLMIVFSGNYAHAIDAKNRLAIPAKHRSRMDPERDGKCLVVVPGQPADRLWLYTERHFEQLAARADSTLIPDDDQLRFDQAYFPLAEYLEIDAQGRILVPEWMVKRANLGHDVVICGVRDHLELRRRDTFEKELDLNWQQHRELQLKARSAYQDRRRQTGPDEAGSH